MPIRFGPLELIILLVIIVLLFGVGRISKIAGELGNGIRAFRDGLQSKEEKEDTKPLDKEDISK
jgi:sec-independent protein translocase protein TatA